MEFETWLSAKGFDPEAIDAQQRTYLEGQWRAESGGGTATTGQRTLPVAKVLGDNMPDGPATESSESLEDKAVRIAGIMQMARGSMQKWAAVGNVDMVKKIRGMADVAVSDEGVSVKDFQLELLRNTRVDAPTPYTRAEPEASAKVIEAAVCRYAGSIDLEKHFDVRTLEASEKQFRHGLSLVGLLYHSAQRNGWRGMPDPNSRDFLRAAFGHQGGGSGEYDLRAGTTGPSTYSLPTSLGNVANKYLRNGFMGVDAAWNRIAAKRSVNNFQAVTGVSLNGATIYRPLAPGGEIKHATLTETTYTNRASTYAIMLGIRREDMVNDDAGVFSRRTQDIGRGAGLKINDLFWTAFLNNSAFFTSGNNNVSTGAGSALGTAEGAAINAAEVKFINQTGADGYPIAVMPKILLAPPTIANTGRRWMGSQGFTISGTAGGGDSNIYQGRYELVTSPYMESAAYTGNSTAAWYLLADPADVPVIEGVALNGRWEPTVDTAEADFNQLGIAVRGFIDVGFALYEYRGGVRSAGA